MADACSTDAPMRTKLGGKNGALPISFCPYPYLRISPTLNRLLCGKTAPRSGQPPPSRLNSQRTWIHGLNTSSLVRLLLSDSWRSTTRTTAHSSLLKAFHLELSSRYRSDGSDSRSPIGTQEPRARTLVAGLANLHLHLHRPRHPRTTAKIPPIRQRR